MKAERRTARVQLCKWERERMPSWIARLLINVGTSRSFSPLIQFFYLLLFTFFSFLPHTTDWFCSPSSWAQAWSFPRNISAPIVQLFYPFYIYLYPLSLATILLPLPCTCFVICSTAAAAFLQFFIDEYRLQHTVHQVLQGLLRGRHHSPPSPSPPLQLSFTSTPFHAQSSAQRHTQKDTFH